MSISFLGGSRDLLLQHLPLHCFVYNFGSGGRGKTQDAHSLPFFKASREESQERVKREHNEELMRGGGAMSLSRVGASLFQGFPINQP